MLLWRAERPVHTSFLVGAFCLGICIGAFLPLAGLSIFSLSWLVVATTLIIVGFIKGKGYSLIVVLLAGGIIGLWRSSDYVLQIAPYNSLMGQTVTVKGKVKDDSDLGKRGEVVLRLGDIEMGDRAIEGSIWIISSDMAEVKRSDIVTVRGKLSEGFGSFAASIYRAEFVRLERQESGDIALSVRDWFSSGVRQSIPEPEASLGLGYVVGQRRSLPEDLDKALRAAGLTHIVVASGYNLTILVTLARRLFARVSKFLALFLSSGMTLGFMAVTGMSPSMSRAGLVTGLGLVAWYYGRRFHPLVLLPLAGAITLLIHPAYGQNDLGWQLSFAAFAGVLIMAPLLQAYFYGSTTAGIFRQVAFETICAWIWTAPLIALAFGQLSNVAILANLLILPLVPLAMLLTFVAGMVALVVPAVTVIVGVPATFILGYMTKVALYLGNVSWAQTEITITPLILLVYYMFLVMMCGYAWNKTRFNFLSNESVE